MVSDSSVPLDQAFFALLIGPPSQWPGQFDATSVSFSQVVTASFQRHQAFREVCERLNRPRVDRVALAHVAIDLGSLCAFAEQQGWPSDMSSVTDLILRWCRENGIQIPEASMASVQCFACNKEVCDHTDPDFD